MNKKTYSSLHNHTSYSNIRLRDAVIKVPELIEQAHNFGLNALAITDHEALSAHVKAKKYFNSNREKLGDMKLILGNEIYLVERDKVNELKEKNEKIRFNHFILLAKNRHGYEGLMKLSTIAWENSFFYRGMQRVPTYYDELSKLMNEYKGDIIASSACLGGIIPQLLLEYHQNRTKDNYNKVINQLKILQDMFGEDNFYLELQPSNHKEQEVVNDYLIKISNAFNIKKIVTTDTHYLSKEQKEIHKIYLQSNGDDKRDVDSFYDTTYMMDRVELETFFDKDLLQEMFDNTNEIANKIEEYDLEHKTIIPESHIPEFNYIKLNDYANIDWSKYPIIQYYESSQYDADRYYIKLIMDGMVNHHQPFDELRLNRIETELDIVKAIGDFFGKPMSGYFLVDKEFIDIMWRTSLVGVSRGSASSFYTNYLIDLVQIDPLKYNLPEWRFLNKDRLDNLADIDLDAESNQRENIINNVKERFGNHNVINIGTFSTEGTRSAVLTASRGIGMSVSEANNILDLIPNEKGINWSLSETINGTDDKQPVKEFIDKIAKYPYLKETMLAIEGIISGVSVHASGVVVMNDGYQKHFPGMQTRNGIMVSQFDAHDVEYVGGLKFDFLSIDALSRIRSSMDLLIKDNQIEWQGSIKSTYDKYLHPDIINVNDQKLYDAIYNGDVPSVFQFNTNVGLAGLQKVHPEDFEELSATNSLIRLTTSGEQPIDKYIKFKADKSLWDKEMKDFGLNESEIDTLKSMLSQRYGIADSQEILMIISMNKNISNFSLKEANKLRKSVAKKDAVLQEKEKELFFKKSKENGTRDIFAKYVWEYCVVPQLGYSFSLSHIAGYTLIAIIEAYIAVKYGSIYWKTACLSVDAGITDNEVKGIDYVKLSKAVVAAKDIVELPDINKSEIGFIPVKNMILFGLGGIAGLGLNDINLIIDNRPYSGFMDFMNKIGHEFSKKKIVTIIKSGLFHNFISSTSKLATMYLMKYTERKAKLTTVQLPKIINDVPDEFEEAKIMYQLKSLLFGRNAMKELPKNNVQQLEDLQDRYGFDIDYTNGNMIVDKKSFEKVFNDISKDLKEWLKSKEAIELLARVDMQEFWNSEFNGGESKWYFDTLSYYPYKHYLEYNHLDEQVELTRFNDMNTEGHNNGKRTTYDKHVIAGTVIEKNIKGLVTLVSPDDEVITVRLGKDRYGKYNKKIMQGSGKNRTVLDDSWLNKGTNLMIIGYRRGNDFIANNYGTGFDSIAYKILVKDNKIEFVKR